jgi:hypothetical protein
VGRTVRVIMWWAGVALLGVAAASALTLGAIWLAQGVARPLAAIMVAAAIPTLLLYARLLVREWRAVDPEPVSATARPKRPVRRTPEPVADEDLAGISLWDIPAPLPRGGTSAR